MKVIGYTTGVFDLFHIGHLNILKRAKQECDELIVGVTTDELCESHKGRRPFISFEERLEIVESLKMVDRAVPQKSMDKHAAWEELGFDKMFVGDDWKGTDAWNKIEADLAQIGVSIVYVPYTKTTSSSIRRKALTKITGGEGSR